jgi:hypothetical protein
MMKKPQDVVKYLIGFVVCIFFRLVTRAVPLPNVEPVTGTLMPFGKRAGWIAGSLFGAASIALFDLVTGKLGVWTIVTAAMFGLIGAAAGLYLKHKKSSVGQYVGFSIVATLIYDFITGPIMSSIIFKLPFTVALIGQIPFTLWHLGGNIVFAALLSPALYKWVVDNAQLEWSSLVRRFGAKAGA